MRAVRHVGAVLLGVLVAPGCGGDGADTTVDLLPSFDCQAAEGQVEQEICADPELTRPDLRVDSVWGEALGEPVFWSCNGNPANEFVTIYHQTDPQAARVERGDQSEIFLRTPTASGARYEGSSGRWFWSRGDSAMIAWPQTDTLNCVVRSGVSPLAR